MGERTINPLTPVTRTPDGLKKGTARDKGRQARKKDQSGKPAQKKKGIVDTYA